MVIAAVVVATLIAIIVVFGIHPRGGKALANTQMMTAARVVLVVAVVVLLFVAFRG